MRSETETLLLRLAWAQEDCPNRDEVNYYGRAGFPSSRAHIYEDWSHYRQEGRDLCPICKGRGKVPLFPDDVRVECKQIHNLYSQEGSGIRSASCSEVGCLGWIPSTDPIVWVVMAEAEGYITALVSDDNGHWAAIGGGVQPMPQQDKPGIPWTTLDLKGALWRDDPFEAILYALEVAIEPTK